MNILHTQVLNEEGKFRLQFETDDIDNLKAMQDLARKLIDGREGYNRSQTMDKRKFAKSMRDGKSVDLYGNIICSLELWERIASIIEDQSDEIDRLLNFMCKIDREQALKDVRCKDCRFIHHNKQLGTYRCMHFGCVMRPEDYCSWGERSRNEG